MKEPISVQETTSEVLGGESVWHDGGAKTDATDIRASGSSSKTHPDKVHEEFGPAGEVIKQYVHWHEPHGNPVELI